MAPNSTPRFASDCARAQLGASVRGGIADSSLLVSSLSSVTRVLVGQLSLVGLVLLVIPT